MSHNKISVIIFGNGESLKKALITNIVGKDFSKLSKRKSQKNSKIYENESYEFICTPDLQKKTGYKFLFSNNSPPDMCLVVVEDDFSEEDVCQQITDLSQKTEKPPDEFTVVLPLREEPKVYPFKSCTIQELLRKLDKLAEERCLTRPAIDPESQNQIENKGWHHFTDAMKIFKKKFPSTKVNLVLLGLAGTGKSASGNTILGNTFFVSTASSKPVTTECQVAEREINGIDVHVIDTPDIFDDELKSTDKDKHVKQCKKFCKSGLCVFVLVIHVSRFTDSERDILKKLEKAFGNKVSEQTVILFTRGDDLQQAEMSLEDFMHSCQPGLKELIKKCGNRCAVFENRQSDSGQVEKLMDTVISVIQRQQK